MAEALRVLNLTGEDAHIEYGRIFSKAIRECSEKVTAENPVLPASFYVMKEKLVKRYPAYYAEVCGRAQGAGVDADAYLAAMSDAIDELHGEHCTNAVVVRPDGRVLFGHNEDGVYDAHNSAIVTYNTAKYHYTEFSATESMPGYTVTLNYNTGVVSAANYIYTKYSIPQEISAQFLLRDIMECSSVEEIREHLGGLTCATGFSTDVFDVKRGRIYAVEMLYDRLDIFEIRGKYAHSNHITHIPGVDPADGGSNTLRRLAAAQRLMEGIDAQRAEISDIERVLEYRAPSHDDTIHSSHGPDYSVTAAAMFLDSRADEITMRDYLGGTELRFPMPRRG